MLNAFSITLNVILASTQLALWGFLATVLWLRTLQSQWEFLTLTFLRKKMLEWSCRFCTNCALVVVKDRGTIAPLSQLPSELMSTFSSQQRCTMFKAILLPKSFMQRSKWQKKQIFPVPSLRRQLQATCAHQEMSEKVLRGKNTPTPTDTLLIPWALLDTIGSSQKTQCNRKSIFVNLSANRATY